jgi:hypothetical protein
VRTNTGTGFVGSGLFFGGAFFGIIDLDYTGVAFERPALYVFQGYLPSSRWDAQAAEVAPTRCQPRPVSAEFERLADENTAFLRSKQALETEHP